MKKYFFFAAIAAMSLASCSNDDVIELKQDEIKFNVVANNTSRAVNVYCNNNMPEDFKVWAYSTNEDGEDVMYINGDLVKKNGTSYATDNVRYWPADKTLNFVAFKNMGGIIINQNNAVAYVADTNNPTGSNEISINSNVAEQVDMLYAITNGQTKAANASAGVSLNFRHLLSQVVFNAKNTNSNNLYIEVTGVKVGNVHECGQPRFNFGTNETTGNFEDHVGETKYTFEPISWEYPTNDYVDYTVAFDKMVLGNTLSALTSANATGKEFSNTAMLLLPQTTTAWVPSAATATPDAEGSGAYVAVNCKIYNVANGDGVKTEKDELLHDGWAYMPVNIAWQQGKKYTYTFIFGQGNGGYDENGDPVLAPVNYNVTVDDFEAVANEDVNMKTIE